MLFRISENFCLKEAEKEEKYVFEKKKMPECFVCSKNVVPLHRQTKRMTIVLSILGYGVMVTQQILVLFFLVRVRVAQP